MHTRTTERICNLIEQHEGRAGMVDTDHLWRDLKDLSMEPETVETVITGLEGTGYLWRWDELIILPRKTVCPGCNREIMEPLSRHMHEDHPCRDVAWVEWAD